MIKGTNSAEEAKPVVRYRFMTFPSHWPMSVLSAGAFYGFIAGTAHMLINEMEAPLTNEPFLRSLYSAVFACNKTFVRFAAYGFLFESAACVIYPPWSIHWRQMNKYEPVECFYSAPTNVDTWAFGGAMGASALAALLRMKRGRGVIGGWERYVGAASLGAFAGTLTSGVVRDCSIRMGLLLGEESRFLALYLTSGSILTYVSKRMTNPP